MNSWAGRYLEVDLTVRNVKVKEISEDVLRKFLGGRGLAAYLLYKNLEKGVDPFDPKNILIFSVGPLTGTPVPTSKSNLTSKSPLTGTIFDSQAGGTWGVKFKKCGYDALLIKGRSEKPVYLKVTAEGVDIKDASSLWGLDALETKRKLEEAEGTDFSVACIGQAGENLVRMACVIVDATRAFGRGGLGAVMGSKKLKAVIVSGKGRVDVHDRKMLNFLVYEANKNLKAHPITSKALPKYGTAVLVNLINEFEIFPTKNFQRPFFEGASNISGEAIRKKILRKTKSGCFGCGIIRCERETQTKNMKGKGPEYEGAWALGADCEIDDLQIVAEANYLCNLYGLDCISTGGTIACAMELTERGLLPGGIRFGESEKLCKLVKMIAFREGIGDELAEGSKRLAEKYKAPHLAMHVKGLELPGYDPRGAQGMGLSYATSTRGACHLRGGYIIAPKILGVPRRIDRFIPTGKAGHVIKLQDFGAAIDSLVVCRFTTFALSEISWARMLSAVTGIGYSPEDLIEVGERVYNLERLFNLREGFTSKDDTLPPRLLEEPVRCGPKEAQVVHLKEMLEEYYSFREWDKEGVPKKEKLKSLGILEEGGGGNESKI